MPGVRAYTIVAALLLGIGIYGVLVRRHAIAVLIAIEIMLNAAALNFVSVARLQGTPQSVAGPAFAIFIITVAAAEAIVGLALVLSLHRSLKTSSLDRYNLLKW